MDGYRASTYGDGFADVYDTWYGQDETTDATVEFIGARADLSVGPVFELGIGTGRIALPLAARGFDVRGIDASEQMVARLRAKAGGTAIPVSIADMASVQVPRRAGEEVAPACSVVCCLNNTFFGIVEQRDQQQCLHQIRSILAPAGALVLGAFVPADDGEDDDRVTVRSMTTDTIVLSVARSDHRGQRIEGHFVEMTEAGTRLRPWMVRYAGVDELDEMARIAGLRLTERFEDATGTMFGPDSANHVSVYRTASDDAPRGP